MNIVRSTALLAALALSPALIAPAAAMTVANVSSLAASAAAPVEFSFADQLVPGRPSRLDGVDAEAAAAAVETYFDFDALFTFGALALAGGALGAISLAAARRKAEDETARDEDGWRDTVFRAVQADLAEFAQTYRRAA